MKVVSTAQTIPTVSIATEKEPPSTLPSGFYSPFQVFLYRFSASKTFILS